MVKQTHRTVIAIAITTLSLVAFNNCAPSTRSISSVSEQNETNDQNVISPEVTTQKIELISSQGNVRLGYEGCTPGAHTDFITKVAAHKGRLEPQDCAKLSITTPVFVWPLPRDWKQGTTFTLTISHQTSTTFATRSIVTPSPRNFVSNPLPAGKYRWKVAYTNTLGQRAESGSRLFEVSAGSFTIPSGQTFARAVMNKSHPRIQPQVGTDPNNKLDWVTIRNRINSNGYSASLREYLYVELNKSVDFKLPLLPINRNQSLQIKKSLTNMAYAYHLLNDPNYFNRAKILLDGLIKWQDKVAVDSDSEDQVNRELHSAMAICLDLFHVELNKSAHVALRNSIVQAVKKRMGLVQFTSYNWYPYDSHLLTNSFYSIESMMYAAGTPGMGFGATDDGGYSKLVELWENAIISVGTWAGTTDFGWANSSGYGWYGADAYVRFLTHTKLMANINLTSWHALGKFGLNQIYFNAPLNVIRQPFGDDGDATNYYQQYSDDTFRLFAMVTRKPEYDWYWKVRGASAINNKAMMNPLHYMVAATYTSTPTYAAFDPASLSKSVLYADAGLVAMHSDTSKPDRTSVYFRSSRFGSYNHNHADQNAFTFVSKGKDILISNGIYDSYNSAHLNTITRATRYKNALTFDGGVGQAEPTEVVVPNNPGKPIKDIMDFHGRIVNYSDDGVWVVATGDASKAYGGMKLEIGRFFPFVQKAYRTVAYNRQLGLVVVYDWARSDVQRYWELNYHTLKSNYPTFIPGSGQAIRMANEATSACLKVWTPTSIPYYYNDFKEGWEIQPEKTEAQLGRPIHPTVSMRAVVRNPSQEFTAVTIINEGCSSSPIEVTFSGTSEAYVFVNGVKVLTMGGLTVKTP